MNTEAEIKAIRELIALAAQQSVNLAELIALVRREHDKQPQQQDQKRPGFAGRSSINGAAP